MDVRFDGNNGHGADLSVCPLMTHSGHGQRATLALPLPSPRAHLVGLLRVEQLCKQSHDLTEGLCAQWERGKSMSDVEKEIYELQCKLTAKTREIEALVAEELNIGNINAMEGTTYARLRTYVEELMEKWQQANVDRSGSNSDTAVNRLIAEREEIEEQILTLQVR